MPLTPGSSFGPYRIIEPLGRGGMASVHKAYEAGLGYVALKALPAEFLHDATFSERLRREAKTIARLEHPNIIPIYAYGIDEGTPWVAMRLVTGGTLSTLFKQGALDPQRGLTILGGVATALDYAHGQGVFHRDVKPQNVLVEMSQHVYLADFGIARIVEGSSVLTRTGLITGTPHYMAPEQAQGAKTLDQAGSALVEVTGARARVASARWPTKASAAMTIASFRRNAYAEESTPPSCPARTSPAP